MEEKKTSGIPQPEDPRLPNLITLEELKDQEKGKCGMFNIKTANQTLQDAALRPNPVQLWLSLWYEHETCCLFADSNVGKSVYAVQMASEIAKRQKVLYFDFELSDKQFQLRYSDDAGLLYDFPADLYRIDINPEALEVGKDFEDIVIQNIEQTALKVGAEIVIIDNLTWLCNASEKGEAAGTLMKSLLGLKIKYGWSLLVIAHTPKRNLANPITQNDLAGSKKLFNLFDSAFSIGLSAKDAGLRYIKQLKIRSGTLEYHSENVIVCSIEKTGAFLHFSTMGFATEKEHLKEIGNKEEIALKDAIIQLQGEGKTYREIALELGISPAKVCRILKK